MIYHFSLQAAGGIAGLILCLLGAIGLTLHGPMQKGAVKFPRSRVPGIVLLAIDLVWSFWLVSTMEMGEFSAFRRPLLIGMPIAFLLTVRFVDEFLAVRALGILFLLAAEPLLDAAFFRYEASRLVLTVFAYVLIVFGLIWVTMPYTLRDQINWLGKRAGRWRGLHALSFIYGGALIVLALFYY
jgi:hypothetical protein